MYWLMKALAAWVSWLSPRGVEKVASAVAWLAFDVLRLRRALMLRNIATAFPQLPPPAGEALARRSLASFATTALEFLRSDRFDIAASVDFIGEENLRQALSKGQGVYMLCFHMGSWEAMAAALTRRVVPAHVLVKKVGSSGLDRYVSEVRARNRFLSVPRRRKGDGYRAILEILARGEIVGFVIDQARPGEPKLPFFGRPAKTNTSLAAIWRRRPAPIVPAYARRVGLGRHVIEIMPELTMTTTEDAAADILRQSTQFNAIVEACILKNPDQYFWMHDRWK